MGTLGAAVALAAVLARVFPLFLAGTLLLGVANSANQLSRYAAADMVPADRRATTLSRVVWAATIGGILGPSLGTLAGRLTAGSGVPRLTAGVYVVTLTLVGCAAGVVWALLRPDPSELAWAPDPSATPAQEAQHAATGYPDMTCGRCCGGPASARPSSRSSQARPC
ncbi:MAG: MFS transporter [Chloroflexota bacterium]